MKKTILALLITIFVCGLAADYYDGIGDLNQQALLNALRNLIDTNTYSSYDGAKDFLFQELDNVSGT
ncbi:MAG: hypothetical protein PHS23_07775, partial [Candidatus Cloacimonetes bacterium]|nr:hypothetical protein [Candidatus Cloacimonadota bacterium]